MRAPFAVLVLAAALAAGEAPSEPVLARWTAAVSKAGQAYAAAVSKADAAVLREAERAALAATRKGEVAAAIAAWAEALRVDPAHAKAREALSALGRLDDVLAGLSGTDLLDGGPARCDDPEVKRAVERRERTMREEAARRAEAWTRADASAIPDLERLAQRALGKGDIAGARSAWYEVLRLDRQHAKARDFFAGAGQLDAVVAELDVLGDPRLATTGAAGLRGAAAAFIFTPRGMAQQDGRWLVRDAAGGKPALVNGLAVAPDKPWLAFDGSVTVEVPDASLVRQPPFTVAVWYRPQPQSGGVGLVGDYLGGSWNGFMLQLEGPGVAAWLLRSHGNEVSICNELDRMRPALWRPGEWQHAAASVDDKELVLYADAKVAARQPWRGQSGPATGTGALRIGQYGAVFRGEIASVLFWRRVLPPAEVAAVAADTAPARR